MQLCSCSCGLILPTVDCVLQRLLDGVGRLPSCVAANLAGVAVDAALLRWPKLCGIDLDLGVDFGELEHLFEQRPNRALCAGADVVRFSGVTVLQQQEVAAAG